MVVGIVGPNVDVEESGDVGTERGVGGVRVDEKEVGRGEVESSCVPVQLCGEVFDAKTVVAELGELLACYYEAGEGIMDLPCGLQRDRA